VNQDSCHPARSTARAKSQVITRLAPDPGAGICSFQLHTLPEICAAARAVRAGGLRLAPPSVREPAYRDQAPTAASEIAAGDACRPSLGSKATAWKRNGPRGPQPCLDRRAQGQISVEPCWSSSSASARRAWGGGRWSSAPNLGRPCLPVMAAGATVKGATPHTFMSGFALICRPAVFVRSRRATVAIATPHLEFRQAAEPSISRACEQQVLASRLCERVCVEEHAGRSTL
jgi:hypothetical protein